jgi:hypothetical protein
MTDAPGGPATHEFRADENTAADAARHFLRYSLVHSSVVWTIPLFVVIAGVGAYFLFPSTWWTVPPFILIAFAFMVMRTLRRHRRTFARSFPPGAVLTTVFTHDGYWHTGPLRNGFERYQAFASVGVSGDWVFLKYLDQPVWRIVPHVLIPESEFPRFRAS